MVRRLFLPSAILAALALDACSGGSNLSLPVARQSETAAATTQSVVQASAQRVLRAPLGATSLRPASANRAAARKLCVKPADGMRAGCFAATDPSSTIGVAFPGGVYGLSPLDLSYLYDYPAPGAQGALGVGQTVAVVVAGNYAAAESDLGVYRKFFGLPPCTTANGCLSKVGAGAAGAATGFVTPWSVSANATNTAGGWAAETDADIEVVSAVCPQCKIMIAEAASDSIADLTNAVTAAINAKASIVNASFGAPEIGADAQYANAYSNPRVKVVAAAGDWGFGVNFPASQSNVIAVGGTSLAVSGNAVAESVWPDTGSGCSTVFAKMSWQHQPSASSACMMRSVADVAAVADPSTGVAIYDSTLNGASGGWSTFGGTSVSAPIITAMYALSGDDANGQGAQHLYAQWSAFLPVTHGSNGTCAPLYLCTASNGYNGPTGLGVPHGLSAF